MKEIRKIIDQYDKIDHTNEQVALASVVDVEASAYRRIGARMLVQSSGIWTGGISGGCLEGDALRRSQKAIFQKKPATVIYDTMDDDNNQIGVGLGCNGRIEVLLNPINPDDGENEIEILRRIKDDIEPNVLMKIVSHHDRSLIGLTKAMNDVQNIDGFAGLSMEQLKDDYQFVINKRRAKLFQYGDEDDPIKLLIEFVRPETRLIIAGDNYDIYAMLGIAQELGWKSTVLGKAKKLSKHVYDVADQVLDYEAAASLKITDYTAVLLMTHDYKHDLNLLKIFKSKAPAYMGILGPKKRFLKLQNDIGEDLSQYSFLHSPTGLEIGAESPEEIAMSICSEIVAFMRDKKGGTLHSKQGPIHERD